jgi:2-polyprenyl-3-methyl-5-hydroxy-6-metoxy-1,4-benzoquinol methylase
MMRLDAKVLVLDVQEEAGATYESVFGSKGSFVLGDVITYSADRANTERFDLVFSFGLIEHFPDKRDILDAHIELAKPGGIVLLYVPIDSPDNRELTAMAAEWENFGYRELLTVDELAEVCADPRLDVLAAEPVGFFSAVWARRKTT